MPERKNGTYLCPEFFGFRGMASSERTGLRRDFLVRRGPVADTGRTQSGRGMVGSSGSAQNFSWFFYSHALGRPSGMGNLVPSGIRWMDPFASGDQGPSFCLSYPSAERSLAPGRGIQQEGSGHAVLFESGKEAFPPFCDLEWHSMARTCLRYPG